MFETGAWERARKAALDKRRPEIQPQLRVEDARCGAPVPPGPPAAETKPAYVLKLVRRGETLFRQGDLKKYLYRVEAGRLSLLLESAKAPPARIEDLVPGTVFDLGYRDKHIYTAVAVADSTVSCWPRSALAYLTQASPSAAERQASSIEREIAHVRSVVGASAANRPLARLALLLSVLARQNAREGRNPQIIDDTMCCGVVADYLKMDLDTLGRALVALERRKIIAAVPPDKLFIRDPAQLDRLTSSL